MTTSGGSGGAGLSGGSLSPSSTTAPTSESYSGDLYPGHASASQAVESNGNLTATAQWTGGGDLTLTVTCPDGQQSVTGTSSLTTSASGSGQCEVALAETATAAGNLDAYELSVVTNG